MNAKLAPSGAPNHHLKVWSDGKRIFVEIPGIPTKAAYITDYPYDSRGMNLMLSLLGIHRVDYDYLGVIPDAYHKGPHTPEQHASAEATLLRLGMLQPHQVRK